MCNSCGTALLRNQYALLCKTHADCACNSVYRFTLKSFLPLSFAISPTRRLTHGMRVISQFFLYFNYTHVIFSSWPSPQSRTGCHTVGATNLRLDVSENCIVSPFDTWWTVVLFISYLEIGYGWLFFPFMCS